MLRLELSFVQAQMIDSGAVGLLDFSLSDWLVLPAYHDKNLNFYRHCMEGWIRVVVLVWCLLDSSGFRVLHGRRFSFFCGIVCSGHYDWLNLFCGWSGDTPYLVLRVCVCVCFRIDWYAHSVFYHLSCRLSTKFSEVGRQRSSWLDGMSFFLLVLTCAQIIMQY